MKEKRYNLILGDGFPQIAVHSDDLKFYQKHIKGLIEIVNIFQDYVLVIDDEGKLKDLPLNIDASLLYGAPGLEDYIVGPAIVDKRSGPDLIGLTLDECVMFVDYLNGFQTQKELLRQLTEE